MHVLSVCNEGASGRQQCGMDSTEMYMYVHLHGV